MRKSPWEVGIKSSWRKELEILEGFHDGGVSALELRPEGCILYLLKGAGDVLLKEINDPGHLFNRDLRVDFRRIREAVVGRHQSSRESDARAR